MTNIEKMLKRLLIGGLIPRTITCLYGPPNSGKTNIALIAAASVAKDNKVIYIDSEGGFSPERLKQICGENVDNILKNIMVIEPNDFDEQKVAIMKLNELVNKSDAKLVIVDSIGVLYRLEEDRDVKELGRIIAQLMGIARKNNIPILMTNQVYTDIESGRIVPVGGDIIKYWSKIIIELKISDRYRSAILKKHKFMMDGIRINFDIVDSGIKVVSNGYGEYEGKKTNSY